VTEQISEIPKSQNSGNGRNGAYAPSPETMPEQMELRRLVVSLLVFGNPGDAQLAYYSAPGTSPEGWEYLERACLQIRGFLESGDPPYLRPSRMDVWEGVMTPQGDCAEDGMPLGYQNDARRAAEAEWFEKRG
jgi:hypothetical protein